MNRTAHKYDIFISYAREDQQWVREHVYEPLLRCRTEDGRAPHIFFDISREGGIQPGQDFMEKLCEAVDASHFMVPVYSPTYFAKYMCTWELNHRVFILHQPITPVLKSGDPKDVPAQYCQIQFLEVAAYDDWFDRLCDSLHVRQTEQRIHLVFDEQPQDTPVNHTLAPVCVELRDEGGALCLDTESIAMSLDGGSLQGTIIVEPIDGRARFEDLAISTVMRGARLAASGNGLGRCLSEPFDVLPSETRISRTDDHADHVHIDANGEAVFFTDAEAVAIVENDKIRAFATDDAAAGEIASVELAGPVRTVHRSSDIMVFTEWSGRVHMIAADGQRHTWPLDRHAPNGGFMVPGDVAIDADALWVGLWNGSIGRLTWDGQEQWIHQHIAGVTHMAAVNGCQCFADMNGHLHVMDNGTITCIGEAEPILWAMKTYGNSVMVVGETHLYHIDSSEWRVLNDHPPKPMNTIADVFDECERPVVIDREGRGAQYDSGLGIVATFLTTPGASPVAADNAGTYCVFRNPDGSRTLLDHTQVDRQGRRASRIVFSHVGGTLSVAPNHDRFAIGQDGTIRILCLGEFRKYLEGPTGIG